MTDASGNGNGKGTPEVIGVRRGMFGAEGTGDTSGYGRLIRPDRGFQAALPVFRVGPPGPGMANCGRYC